MFCSTQMTDPSESWTEEGSGSRMRTDFADFVGGPATGVLAASFRDDYQWCINGQSKSKSSAVSGSSCRSSNPCYCSKVAYHASWIASCWVHPKGCLVPLRGMCHPMLVCTWPATSLSTLTNCGPLTSADSFICPYGVQGTEISGKDTVVLNALFSYVLSLKKAHPSTRIPR